jgi:hypothetical protein
MDIQRPQGGGRKTHLTHPDYFDDIVSERQAYWLGYIYADGSVRLGNAPRLSLNVKPSDFYHVERFQKEIGSHHKPYKMKSVKAVEGTMRVDISSVSIVRGLIAYGCHPNKMYDLEPPTGLPENLIRHFIRGFWDGDGSVGQYGKYKQLHMSATGTDSMINWIHKQFPFKSYVGRSGNQARVRSTSYYALMNMHYLYENSTISLDRKKDFYIQQIGGR